MSEAPHRAVGPRQETADARRRAAVRGRRWGRALLLAGVVVLTAWAAVTAWRVFGLVRSLLHHAEALEVWMGSGNLTPGDLEAAGEHLAALRSELEALQAEARPFLPLTRYLSWVPLYGGDLDSAPQLLEFAVAVAQAGDGTYRALSPALDLFDESPDGLSEGSGLGARLVLVLLSARPQLALAQGNYEAATVLRERIDASRLSPRVSGLLAKLDQTLPWLGTGLAAATLSADLLGAGQPRTFLVLAQNNDELRATGGFISGVGELQLEDGQIVTASFGDSYAVDNLAVPHEVPPAGLRQTLFGELWLFRDSNWDADFPTSARRAVDIYTRDRGVEVDGVIALDLTALQWLLEAIGPLAVGGIDEPVTGANAVQVLQNLWASPSAGPALAEGEGQEWWRHRKDFMGEIAGAALQRLVSGRDVPLARLAGTLRRALDEKHLLIYLVDPGASRVLRERNWDGAVPDLSPDSDLLLVVDSNVGFNKADPNIDRSITYRVDLGAGDFVRAQVTVTYHHRSSRPAGACVQEATYGSSYAAMMDRCYWDYLRIYAPGGSVLLEGPGLKLPSGSLLARHACPEGCFDSATGETSVTAALVEGTHAVWTSFFDLEPLAERALTFAYRLPDRLVRIDAAGVARYSLRVQKQPGTDAVPLRLEVTLPPSAEWLDSSPRGVWDLEDGVLVTATDLRADRTFEILFRPGGVTP